MQHMAARRLSIASRAVLIAATLVLVGLLVWSIAHGRTRFDSTGGIIGIVASLLGLLAGVKTLADDTRPEERPSWGTYSTLYWALRPQSPVF
jgi:hypothetical protein